MAHEPHAAQEQHGEHASMDKKTIWKVAGILSLVTAIEFIIALALNWPQDIKNMVYIVLTVVKAFYIVAYFMHLKFEKITLIISILIPILFIVYFIVLALMEGNSILHLRLF